METNISSIRKEYKLHSLNETDVAKSPIKQLQIWLDEAVESKISEPTAMALATSTVTGRPSIRMVLLKEIDDKGLVFFTNYESYKARQLEGNPFAALLFFWSELERQVRIEGIVEKVSVEESDKYFVERPEGSKIGAWASEQSSVIPSRLYLELKTAEYYNNYKNREIPRPDNWGGYRIIPSMFEFWQGRESRLHDRIRYQLNNNNWIIERLAP